MPKVTLKNVKIGYKIRRRQIINAVEEANVVFPDGKISVIIGESGCGKTSILRSIVGLINPLEGEIYFDNTLINKFDVGSRNVAYVSQMIGLYPNLSIFNNIAFPLKVSHCGEEEIRERVAEIADVMKITHCLARKPRELSIGQCQRVAIARAMVKRSLVYLFDEPFSNLDKPLSHQLTIEIKEIFSRLRATVIFVSHDINEALAIADRVFVMHEGKFIAEDTPEKIIKHKDERITKLFEDLK